LPEPQASSWIWMLPVTWQERGRSITSAAGTRPGDAGGPRTDTGRPESPRGGS
jgi:hypothetical protein